MTKITLILALFTLTVYAGKSLVLFKNGDNVIQPLAAADSVSFTGAAGSRSVVIHSGASAATVAVSESDSIRFYDGTLVLTPEMLYNGYKAYPMIYGSGVVTLDLRERLGATSGEIITDVIDLLDMENNGVSPAAALSQVTIETQATTPSGTGITLAVRSGNNFFSQTSGWSAWTNAGLNCELASPAGRYLQLRYTLQTSTISTRPTIRRADVYAKCQALPSYQNPVGVTSYQNEKILDNSYTFGWETRVQSTIQSFISATGMVAYAAQKTDEWEKYVHIMDWVARRANNRSYSWSTYPWDINQVYVSGQVKGHCMSYAEVLVTAFTGLGYYARHWAIQGVDNNNNHEVAEVWSNKYKKWIYMDASLDTYYANATSSVPNSILENHDCYMNNLPITNVDLKYHYGVYTPTYNWQSLQGYTTCGYMEMTERNNFHSQPNPVYTHFGDGVNSYFRSYTDNRTPLIGGTNFSGRQRDFWWTMNQASIKAKRTGETQLTLEFGNSQPFFKQYRVSVDGGGGTVVASPYTWNLHAGQNSISVVPEDTWNAQGIPSSLTLTY